MVQRHGQWTQEIVLNLIMWATSQRRFPHSVRGMRAMRQMSWCRMVWTSRELQEPAHPVTWKPQLKLKCQVLQITRAHPLSSSTARFCSSIARVLD
jgi:hypothetical protein